MKIWIYLIILGSIFLSSIESFSSPDCNGKVTFAEGDAKIKYQRNNSEIISEILFVYINSSIMGSNFEAKSRFGFLVPEINAEVKIPISVQKVSGSLGNGPDDCSVNLEKFPTFKDYPQTITIRRTEENKLTFRCNFSLYATFYIKCNNEPSHMSETMAGGQPGGYLVTEIREGSANTICNNSMINIGENKWCSSIKIISTSGEDPQKNDVNVGDKVSEGDVIETGNDGSVEVTFADKSAIRIGPNSRVTITKSVCRNADREESGFHISFGAIWSRVSSTIGGSSKFNVTSQNAITGVRGTIFVVETKIDSVSLAKSSYIPKNEYTFDEFCKCYTKTTTKLSVIEGIVEFSNVEKEKNTLDLNMTEIKDLVNGDENKISNIVNDDDENSADEEISQKELSEEEIEAQDRKKAGEIMKSIGKSLKPKSKVENSPEKILVQGGYESSIFENQAPTTPIQIKKSTKNWFNDEKFKK